MFPISSLVYTLGASWLLCVTAEEASAYAVCMSVCQQSLVPCGGSALSKLRRWLWCSSCSTCQMSDLWCPLGRVRRCTLTELGSQLKLNCSREVFSFYIYIYIYIYFFFFPIAKSVDICCRWFGMKMQKPNQYHCTCHPNHLILEYFHLWHIYSHTHTHTHTQTVNGSIVCFFHLTYEYYMSLKITW